MSRLLPIDLPKLPSFDVSNTSSSITDRFIYGDRSGILTRPKQSPITDPFKLEFARSDLQNVIHIITAELKSKGAKTPFVFLPFREDDEEYKLKKFLSRVINESEFIEEELLTNVVKRTDEFTLVASLKFFWCRLPSNAIIGWKSYNKFAKLEKEKGYPKKAFLTIMPYCLSSAAHASIVYDFLDLLVSMASYTKDNKLSGRKICKMCGIWAFNGPPKKSKDQSSSFSKGLGDWVPASDALFHIMLSFLRSILPDDEKNLKQLPKTLQLLVSSNSYPPPPTKHSDPSKLQEVPIITLSVNSPSKSPLELIRKIGMTLTFDNAKLFYSRDDYILLKSLFKDSDHLVDRLSLENKKIIDKVSHFDATDFIVDETFVKYKMAPGWSDDLITFSNQEKIPASQEFFTANVSKTLVDDYFIWTWLSTIGSEETTLKRRLFGKTFILEVELTENYKKWVIIEERDINIELFDMKRPLEAPKTLVSDDSDSDLENQLQQLRKAELELLQKKLKKDEKYDLPPIPVAPPPVPSKGRRLKKLDQSSKKLSEKLASSIRKLSSGDHHHKKHANQESKPLPVIIDRVVPLPRDISEHNFKLPEFEDDDEEDLAGEFKEYLQKSTTPNTKPLNIEQKLSVFSATPASVTSTNIQEIIRMVDDVKLEEVRSRTNSSEKSLIAPVQTHHSNNEERSQPIVSIYGLEQLQQYSPYINYEDGQFSAFPDELNSEKRYSRLSTSHNHALVGQVLTGEQNYQDQSQEEKAQSDSSVHTKKISGSSSSSSRRVRKPPPTNENPDINLMASQQSERQYSDSPITLLSSNHVVRPLSESMATPTSEQQLPNQQDPHNFPKKDYQSPRKRGDKTDSYQTPTLESSRTFTQEHDKPRLPSSASSGKHIVVDSHDKPLPPSPTRLQLVLNQPHHHDYQSRNQSTHTSPVRSGLTSPIISAAEQDTIYGTPYSSPAQVHQSVRDDHQQIVEERKPIPSPTRSYASAHSSSPTRRYYNGPASPSKASLYGDSKTDLLSGSQDGAMYRSTDEFDPLIEIQLEKLKSIEKTASRASAIIENFDMLENELQDFLNDDAASVHTAESSKITAPSGDEPVTSHGSESDGVQYSQRVVSPTNMGKGIDQDQEYYRSQNQQVPRTSPPYLRDKYAAESSQIQSSQPQVIRGQSPARQFSPYMEREGFPPEHQYPVAAARPLYLPNGSNMSISATAELYPPNGSNTSFPPHGSQQVYYPQMYGQQQQLLQPYIQASRNLARKRASPNNTYDQPAGPQNGYPIPQAPSDFSGLPRTNAHSPARPSKLGPNYQSPFYLNQRPSPQQFYIPPPPPGQQMRGPQNYGPPKHGMPNNGYPPQARGRPQYVLGPYNQPPPMQQYYPQPPASPGVSYALPAPYSHIPPLSPKLYNGVAPPPGLITQSDYTIQHMPPALKVNRLHGHTDNRNTNKNLRDAIVTGGFGV